MKKLKDLKGNIYTFIAFEERSIDQEFKSGTHIDHNMHIKCRTPRGKIVYLRALDVEFI